jgi:hypothetical protein
VSAKPTQHAWSSEALFNKALVYVGEMQRYTANDWQFGLWSSFSLEFLARAALAHISPTLLANRKDWRNIYHALGNAATAKLFIPISVTTNEVLSILEELLPDFTKELINFCVSHCVRRNAELHSGEEVFAGLGTSAWLPKYYASCRVLLQSIDKSLADLFDDPETAEDMIASLQDTAAKAVAQDIEAHKQIWEKKKPEERKASLAQAVAKANRHVGHRTKCPACGSPALIRGSMQGVVTTEVGEDVIVQKQTMLPSSFECVACDLKISGLSKLSACGLGDAFTGTSTLSAAAFFGLHTDEELEEARASSPESEEDGYDDFNE